MDTTPKRVYPGNIFDDFFAPPHAFKCDVIDEEKNFIVIADVPGIDKDNLKVDYQNGNLLISSQKKDVKEEEAKNYVRRERYYGEYSRQIYLGEIDADNIKAEYRDGTLKIVVPKLDDSINKKKIDIE